MSGIVLIIAAAAFFFIRDLNQAPPDPSVIRIGVLPDESKAVLEARYEPLLDYLSQETGLEMQLVLPSNYEQLVIMFRERQIELAYFGGFTFVQALISSDAKPLVMREIDTRFTSYYLAKSDSPAIGFSGGEGMSFSFGSQYSTSGHLMPRFFMKRDLGIIPEDFFSEVRYSGTHDSTAYLIRDGKIDFGVANAQIIRDMFIDGRLKEGELRIISETSPYPDYVWAIHQEMSSGLETLLRNAFLGLQIDNEDHQVILEKLGAVYFLPAGTDQYEPLMEIVRTLEILE